jgi:hypothetical protein
VLDVVEKYQPSELYLFLDNDIESCKATESLVAEIQNIPVHNKSSLYKNYKDFNLFGSDSPPLAANKA